MKFFLVTFFCVFLFVCANVNAQKFPRSYERGFSDQYKSENTLGQYAFGYNEDHTSGGSFRRETGDRFGNKIGSYGLRIADGRVRVVNYVADHNGYRADIMTNEPGISNTNSNGYFKITKKGFQGAIIPGFRNSVEAPHVVFTKGNPEEFNDDISHGDKQTDASSSKSIVDTSINGKTNEPRSDYNKNNVDDFSNRRDIDEPHVTMRKNIDGVVSLNNEGNINKPGSAFSKNVVESQAGFPHSNIHERHNPVEESPDSPDQYPKKVITEETISTYSKNNVGESIVGIPLENSLKENSWQGSNQEPDLVDEVHHSQAADINRVKGSRLTDA